MFFYEQARSNERNYLYCQADTNFYFPLHMHKSLEFVTVFDGEMQLQIGNRSVTLQKNAAALILPGQLHAYTPNASKNFLCIFSPDWVYDFYDLVKGKRAENPVFAFEAPQAAAQLTNRENPFLVKSALYQIAGQFLRSCRLTQAADENPELLEKVISYVQKHFREPITLQQLAKTLGYHYNYISSCIHESTGTHFRTFVNLFRIDCACALLTETSDSVTEIAHRCGFESVRSFHRCFRLLQNCTPGEYVRQRQKITQRRPPSDPFGDEEKRPVEESPRGAPAAEAKIF